MMQLIYNFHLHRYEYTFYDPCYYFILYNNKLSLIDHAPTKYHYRHIQNEFNDHHWKHHWNGPVEFTEFDWVIEDQDKLPIKVFPKISIPIIQG